ncbi:DUF6270 domain-containing protein [Arthrobacter sp. zg-Y916]|uniref:DUF6270 domain-containing protein n=1 Tax=Arthrobacter sp. zg-Y916 TaxID=2894190 RepID=UPI001E376DC2|nr:DUF6270 domain-containing protein [Arthrobacter sp. zg-Y916]MCC9193846.1 DUF6270 domain-containing protein [Arthrobacter sp. zg-Y916]
MPKIFIHGSCVSRDTTPYLGEGWEIVAYVARQGMISAANAPAHLSHESHLTSPFQQTCLMNDLQSSLFGAIAEHADETGIVVVDLVDERLGVFGLGEGAFATHTWELDESRLLHYLPEMPPHFAFGTDEHFELWKPAALKVMQRFSNAGLPVIVLAPEWAEESDGGKTDLIYRQLPVSEYNTQYSRYYDYLEVSGVEVFRLGQETVKAAEGHRWGLAPFHYVDEVYEIMQNAIKEAFSKHALVSRH